MNPFMKNILKKTAGTVFIFAVFIYITAIICTIPSEYTIREIDGKWIASYPMKTVLQEANNTLSDLADGGYKYSVKGKDVSKLLAKSIKKSLVVVTIGILVAIVLGILKGIFDSRKGKAKDSSFKILLTIIPISLPDILIVALLQSFALWLIQHGIKIVKVAGTGTWQHDILPIFALSILPACYIARVTAMSIEACYDKEYVKAAIGKGCSSRRILWNHVMRNALGIIFESLSNITAIIISNMLIVEYMFSYPGITTMLVNAYRQSDSNLLIVTIIIIGTLYFTLDLLFQLMKHITFKPLKEDAA